MDAVRSQLQAQQLDVLFSVDAALTAFPDKHHREKREGETVKQKPQRLRDRLRQLRFLKSML